MGWVTSKGNEAKSKTKQPSDMPTPKFEHSGSDLWCNMLPLDHGGTPPCQRYAHYDYENTMVQHSPTTHRLLLPARDTTELEISRKLSPSSDHTPQDISNIWRKLLGSTISLQDVLSGEEDGNIPNYIHLENSIRNCPKCWNNIIQINKAGSPVPSPPNKQCATDKIRATREGNLQISFPNICSQTWCLVTSFKHKLDKKLQSIPDKPKIPGYTNETDTNSIISMRSSRESWALQLMWSH